MGTEASLLVSPVGIEPTTNWLKASCSTTELRAREPTPYGASPMLSTAALTGPAARKLRVDSRLDVEDLLGRLRHRLPRGDRRQDPAGHPPLLGRARHQQVDRLRRFLVRARPGGGHRRPRRRAAGALRPAADPQARRRHRLRRRRHLDDALALMLA